jgi:ATP-binding protein involved in chromosome partitioning
LTDALPARIEAALATVVNPRTRNNVLAGGMIRDLATTTDGKVRFTVLLDAADDATLVRAVRHAVSRLDGVTDLRIDVKDPAERRAPKPSGRVLPVMDAPRAQQQRPAGHVPEPVAYPHLGSIIAVSSGKGGVGKSTVCVNLAVALAAAGARVGVLDADIYGPDIPRMMGVNAPPAVHNEKIQPLTAHGVAVMSLGFLIERDQPAIWRGPIVMKIITQFLRDVAWGTLDYLLVDMPPGTGDAQLSLVQATPIAGALIVTTPQEVAVGDALRGAKMFERVGVPVLGIVENMSWFESPETGKPLAIFGTGGGKRLADELGVPLLGEIPLYPPVLQGGDAGVPVVLTDSASTVAKRFVALAGAVGGRVREAAAAKGPSPGRS